MKEIVLLKWLLNRLSGRIPALICLVLVNGGSALLGVWFALGSRAVIDTAVAGNGPGFLRACLLQLALICGKLLCLTANRYLSDWLKTKLDRDIKRSLLHSLLKADYAKAAQFHSGELVHRLNNDVRQLNDGVIGILPSLVSLLVQLAATVWVLTTIMPVMTLVMAVGGVVLLLGTGVIRRTLRQRQRAVSEADGRVLSFLQEAVERLLVICSMGLDKEVERRADLVMEEREQAQIKRRRLSLTANTAISVVYQLAGFLALVWSAFSLLHGTMSFGTLTVVTQLVNQMQRPFVGLSGVLPRYTAMCTSAERLIELEDMQKQDTAESVKGYNFAGKEGFLTAEGLCFAYDDEKVLQDVSFRLPLGTFTAITGASGIGKSTLLKLMLGVFHPTAGQLCLELDGEQTELCNTGNGLFAYVPQGNLLFSGTLRENILFARPEATREELERAIYVSGMDLYLDQLPDGLDTVLGENGEGLSEGQAQRLAIARAVVIGAPILLLDEATSALDAQTEQIVLERLASLDACTCIAVTHRPAALETADQCLEFSDGTVCVR